MYLESVVWDDGNDTATFTLRDTGQPTPPAGGDDWWPGPGASVTMSVPIKRNTVTTNPTGIQVTADANGVVVYTKFEYRSGAWVNLGRVNIDGSPYTG